MSRFFSPLLSAPILTLGFMAAAQTPKDDPPKPEVQEEKKEEPERPYELMVGDVAPAIHVDEWLTGEAAELENGKLYWIYFWSTWSAPSLVNFESMTALQKKYEDKGLVVIGVTREDDRGNRLFAVKKEIEAHASVIDFRLAWDEKGETWKRFMTASGFHKIPHGYLVDREGRIAYMGHPGAVEETLDKVVEGKFDIEEAARTYAKNLSDALAKREIELRLNKAYTGGRLGEVLLALDELIALGPKFRHYAVNKFQLLLKDMKDEKSAYAWARAAAATCLKEDAYALNTLAYSIVIRADFIPKNYDVAMELAMQASEVEEGKDGQIWNTIGAIHFRLEEWKEAVDAMEKAVEFAPRDSQRESYARTLVNYRKKLKE